MRTDYETFVELRKVKEKILSLDPFKDSALYLEHLVLNAIEISNANIELPNFFIERYNNEIYSLICSQVAADKVRYFKNIQSLIRTYISDKNFLIHQIPEQWTTPFLDRSECL